MKLLLGGDEVTEALINVFSIKVVKTHRIAKFIGAFFTPFVLHLEL